MVKTARLTPPIDILVNMNTGEIITKGTTGIAGSVVAVLSPYQEHMEWAIQVLGGLLGIAVAVVSLYHLLRNKNKK